MWLSVNALPVRIRKAAGTSIRPLQLGVIGSGIDHPDLQALQETGRVVCKAVHDPIASNISAGEASGIRQCSRIEELLNSDLDGVIVASPRVLHISHCIAALQSGKAVFVQKPLARSAAETAAVLDVARSVDRLIAVDFPYRHIVGANELRRLIKDGQLGQVFTADLIFHGVFGHERPWFYECASGGGGCVMDVGVHLVDLALGLLGDCVTGISSNLYRQGAKLHPPYEMVEDYATAEFFLGETQVRLACSWNLQATQDAVIEARFYGTEGGVALRNIKGSLQDFELHQFSATTSRQVDRTPDAPLGGELGRWAARLGESNRFDPEVAQALVVAQVIDRIYSR